MSHVAAGTDPVRPSEAGGAHHELPRVLHQLDPVGVAVLVSSKLPHLKFSAAGPIEEAACSPRIWR